MQYSWSRVKPSQSDTENSEKLAMSDKANDAGHSAKRTEIGKGTNALINEWREGRENLV